MATLRQTIAKIEKLHGPKIARAFAAAIADLKDSITIGRVVAALERGDINAAVQAMNINNAAFAKLRQAITEPYAATGEAVIAAGLARAPREIRAIVRWDITNPVAERSLREWLGQHITQIAEDTRNAARSALADGYARGLGPRQIALDVVGRIGPNGRRVGGVLGLNGPQERTMATMRNALSDPAEYRKFFVIDQKTGRWKNRWEGANHNATRTIRKAIQNGETLTPKQIERILAANESKMLNQRGTAIARTETANAVESARLDAFRMEVEAHNVPDRYVIKEWRHGGGGKDPREGHMAMNGEQVTGMNTSFVLPDGTLMQGPHDPMAPAKHVINCTCSLLLSVDWIAARNDGVL